jgi:hypothetical protein
LSTDSDEEKKILDDYYLKNWHTIPGTCCVGFRAIMLFRLLGFQWFHLFGVDSCYREDGKHHAYKQELNEGENVINMSLGGRDFSCSNWQIAQAMNFFDLIKHMGDKINLNVYGDGLIAHMLKTGSELSIKE